MTSVICTEALSPAPAQAQAMAEELVKGQNAVCGALFYGSGLWRDIEPDTVLDFYLLVDSYNNHGTPLSHRVLGTFLPPNVYYTARTIDNKTVRCKYAVMTLAQFSRAARGFAATPSIFARFAQPCRLLQAKNKKAEAAILTALEEANQTFHRRTLPLLKNGLKPPEVSAKHIWQTGLSETYKSELRSEKKGRKNSIYDAAPESFNKRTALYSREHPEILKQKQGALYQANCPKWRRFVVLLNTPLRRYGGKLVTLLRLIKAPLTFDGAVDYIVWKIERHSGQKLSPTDFQRRHPLIAGWPLLFKVLKNKLAR